ncbi:MAG TPA: cation diffusion facilitator family transporter [Candidatus Bathyarchaeia archaeon]|nr:cation diffusion facilitator family transporter [Candidatus Bathyarchaeia archaeon]
MQNKPQLLGYTEGLLSIGINVLLFGLKYWAGIKSDSVSMIADAWHTMSDTFTSLIIVVSFWIAARPADEHHPFGHGRAEAIGAIIIGTLLAVVGVTFLKESIMRLQNYEAANFASFAIIIFGISVILKEGLAQYSIWAGRKIQSQALLADGWHHRSDAIASGLIVIGALSGAYLWWIDGVMGIAVSVLILYATYEILKGAMSSILGEKPDPLIEEKIKNLIQDIAPAASCLHHVHIHRYGDHVELTLHCKLPYEMNLKEAHDLASIVEEAIRKEMNVEPTLHIEPQVETE